MNMRNIFVYLFLIVVVFPLVVFGQKEDKLDKEFGEILTSYYLKPVPGKIPAIMEKFISSEFFISNQAKQNNSEYITAYSLGRIAQLEPSLIKKYEHLFEKTSHEGRIFILKVFQICGNEEVKTFLSDKLKDSKFAKEEDAISAVLKEKMPLELNLLTKEAKNASDLDFLWVEFLVSGDERAVRKIIDVLDWPDKTRQKLDKYLTSSIAASDKENLTGILLKEYGIKCNLPSNQVETKEDLDIIIATNLQKKQAKSESFQEVKKALNLTSDDILYMATKGSANWALNSNAQQHKKVFEICDNEIPKRSGAAKISLLEISSSGYASSDDIKSAIDRLKQLISLDPANAWAHFALGSAYVEEKNVNDALQQEDMLLPLDTKLASTLSDNIEYLILQGLNSQKDGEVKDEPVDSQVIARIIHQNGLTKTYMTRLTFTDFAQEAKHKGHFTVEWDAEYVFPDKFFVTQSAWEKEGPAYDRWLTIGKEHYFQIGGWFKEPEGVDSDWRDRTNKLLSLDKWIYLIKNNGFSSMKVYKVDNRKFVVIKYVPTKLDYFWTTDLGTDIAYEAEIWVEDLPLLIAKAVLYANGKDAKGNKVNVAYEQVYKGYNSNIKIEKPKEIFDLNKQGLRGKRNK